MLILGIESSCDETAAAIIENGTKIISHAKAIALDPNRKFGGVVPDKTAREQLKFILPIIEEALSPLQATRYKLPAIDALAVTVGPGLIGSLLIGVETAKALALAWKKPLIPVNHLLGHIYATWLTSGTPNLPYPPNPPQFPALALIVSGGHSDLVLMKNHHDITVLGSTLDDAAGECFDKCGRLLGLPYPYGPFIEKEANKLKIGNCKLKITFPRPLIHSQNYNFSFSGLKTAFLNEYNRLSKEPDYLTSSLPSYLALELQEAVTDVLVEKFLQAAQEYQPKSLILTGGVAANTRLREKLFLQAKRCQLKADIHIPPIQLCTDNATYIAAAAYFHPNFKPLSQVNADPSLTISSKL